MPRIQGIALAGDVAQLAANGQDLVQLDSNDFYQVILQRLQVASATQEWEEDFRALFQLDREEHGRCIRCGHERLIARIPETGILLNVPTATTTFNAALSRFFQERRTFHCAICVADTTHLVTTSIQAGPQILKIKLAIFQMKKSEKKDKNGNPQPATEHKINHRMAHPNILDLTQYQENAHLPLRYRLSSVISHSGEGTETAGGHYIASVRGPGDRITCLSDSVRQTFTQAQFEASPQVAGISPPAKQVYVLTYLRDEGRLQREIKNLESTLN
ncbi:hypothetical protein J4E93_003451 [Alternaria ventricosa]|uniref:uncharacterized protein n=1 Tax=Alternaria ventricosa TaxID=1187951 RepID=UPI0020C23705|nr:uncharacterized protein J4E93_003451 [Alternaria ventricosa]KAI4649137.1 hypothetical protein J4E93_003451 [Alternaria ventricosa]